LTLLRTNDNADQQRQALDAPTGAPADQTNSQSGNHGQTDSQSGNHGHHHGHHHHGHYLGEQHFGENHHEELERRHRERQEQKQEQKRQQEEKRMQLQARYQTIMDNDGRNVEGLDEAVHQRIIRLLVKRHPDFAQRYAALNPEPAQPSATPTATSSTTPTPGFIGPLPPPKQDDQEAEVDFTYDGPHEEWPIQESVNQNSEAIFAVLHDQMMDLARKRVTNRALDGEANELALELLARAELPMYIRVRANIVLAGGGNESYLWHAHEALRCVNKGRTIFDKASKAERLASAGLHEEATEAVRRAERDHRQLQLVKKKLASGRYENKAGKVYMYGGNRNEGREDSEDEDAAEDEDDDESDDEDDDEDDVQEEEDDDVEDDDVEDEEERRVTDGVGNEDEEADDLEREGEEVVEGDADDAEQPPEWQGFSSEEDGVEEDAEGNVEDAEQPPEWQGFSSEEDAAGEDAAGEDAAEQDAAEQDAAGEDAAGEDTPTAGTGTGQVTEGDGDGQDAAAADGGPQSTSPPPLRRSQRAGTFNRNYKTGELRR
jgi:hypothetical protein